MEMNYNNFDLFEQTNPNFIFDSLHDNADDTFFADINFSSLTGSGEANVVVAPNKRTAVESRRRILAERMRREKLNESFISLSSLIPGLKKMDKCSIMGGAIRYLKQLQDDIKSLEEEMMMNHNYNKSDQWKDKEEEEEEDMECNKKKQLDDIKAIISGRSILIQIHCDKIRGLESMLLTQIGRLGLTVISSSFLSFGQSNIDITIVTQMNDDFNMLKEDLVKILQFNISNLKGGEAASSSNRI